MRCKDMLSPGEDISLLTQDYSKHVILSKSKTLPLDIIVE